MIDWLLQGTYYLARFAARLQGGLISWAWGLLTYIRKYRWERYLAIGATIAGLAYLPTTDLAHYWRVLFDDLGWSNNAFGWIALHWMAADTLLSCASTALVAYASAWAARGAYVAVKYALEVL